MDVLEIAPLEVKRAREAPCARISMAMLGAPTRPDFVFQDTPPPLDMPLWDRMRLSWQDPGLLRDLTGG